MFHISTYPPGKTYGPQVNYVVAGFKCIHSTCLKAETIGTSSLDVEAGTSLSLIISPRSKSDQISNILYSDKKYIYLAASALQSWAAVQRHRAANLLHVLVAKSPYNHGSLLISLEVLVELSL